jgi:prophage regulatory protein
MNKLIRMKHVKEITTLSSTTIYRKIAAGSFPKQFRLTDKTCAWVKQEVLDWVDERIAERNNK